MLSDHLNALFHRCLPKQALTILAGFLANIKIPAIKNSFIRYFIRQYNINMDEALQSRVEDYPDFNAFFIRQLKPGCRPIADADIISPVDGYLSEMGQIHEGRLLQAKGRSYSIGELLASEQNLSSSFKQGLYATLYLSPQDYHRVHMPISAALKEMIYVPGTLFSVQPTTVRMIPKLFARNERLVVFFDTPAGLMAMVLVGATIVGAIGTSWEGDISRSRKSKRTVYPQPINLEQAEEMGYFKLGSTVILLFAEGTHVAWQNNLTIGQKIRVGQALGALKKSAS